MRQESPREVCSAFSSQLGWMAAVWGEQGLKRLVFGYRSRNAALQGAGRQQSCGVLDEKMAGLVERLCQFAGGQEDDFQDVSVDLSQCTVFQRTVLQECRKIERGHVLSYGDLASRAGYPRAARAVGRVMSTNQVSLIIPCHRVVAAGGVLGGYSAPDGLDMKRRLLQMEGALHRPVDSGSRR